jgi:hypothetical protein
MDKNLRIPKGRVENRLTGSIAKTTVLQKHSGVPTEIAKYVNAKELGQLERYITIDKKVRFGSPGRRGVHEEIFSFFCPFAEICTSCYTSLSWWG